ncbi:5-formyltetrahydrofolate cyclo-ligase [Nonlabens sp. Ci31]|jgi:5-formyltetrahydrofolate cyclo-ligase|uniref:5-formyltetrahydrofolate cyclo-ligase n=1 Tax=Nonlabens sp. Ci31 TaxID=2608253 RepID=UPI001462E494|nr:5-formyltetrahydrofolate cyclo-ligase [Nonlabens sp. Ci31]QJP34068.1 5-formyltetrahydrofolate cyclo-ligase [Nonlabens sp. Ci31]
MDSKLALRKEYVQRRQALTLDQVEEYSLQIANKALEIDIWSHSNYHIFLPIEKQKEINTEYLLHILQGKDKNVVISRSNFKNFSMSNYLLTDQTKLTVNTYGIPEPDENGIAVDEKSIDVVFVPLVAADRFGNRIGYGKGFYDRFLKKCRPDVLKIGLSFFTPLETKIDTNSNDIGMDYIIHRQEILKVI